MNAKSCDCLVKILLQCDAIAQRCQRFAVTQDLFETDDAIADMLLMPLAQIGELSIHVDDAVLSSIMPLRVWKQVRGFRNRVVHDYGTINRTWAWATVEQDIPDLRSHILKNEEVASAYEKECALISEESQRHMDDNESNNESESALVFNGE